MGHYLLYRQGSFLLKEHFADERAAVRRAVALPPSAFYVQLLDFETASTALLDEVEQALDFGLIAPSTVSPASSHKHE